uniref:MATH domain-containing protein n=1 Tax=Oryza rufipogon TaxID=4529 RepID=A0A0E0R6I6_ORYRU
MSSSPTKDVVTASTATSTSVAATGCNLLKIKVRNAIKKSHQGSKYDIESSKFQVAGHTWSFFFHLNASKYSGNGYSTVCLKLHAADSGTAAAAGGIRTNVRFRMVNLQPCVPPTNEVRSYATSFHGTGKAEYRCFTFIRHDVLAGQWFSTDDEFAIHCDVAVVEEAAAAATMSMELGPDDLDGLMMICKCSVDNDDEPCKSGGTRQSHKEAFRKYFLGCFGTK